MQFHTEAKKFLKEHRESINEPPKIKDFLISGITASSYVVIDVITMTPIAAKRLKKKIQIASISKVMTCYLSLLACKKYGIDPKKYSVRITN
jgi:D-alanyl-D-alanine carboxypeptidase